jgi:hypothetical protein
MPWESLREARGKPMMYDLSCVIDIHERFGLGASVIGDEQMSEFRT